MSVDEWGVQNIVMKACFGDCESGVTLESTHMHTRYFF